MARRVFVEMHSCLGEIRLRHLSYCMTTLLRICHGRLARKWQLLANRMLQVRGVSFME